VRRYDDVTRNPPSLEHPIGAGKYNRVHPLQNEPTNASRHQSLPLHDVSPVSTDGGVNMGLHSGVI
jgi:hypothetical protein